MREYCLLSSMETANDMRRLIICSTVLLLSACADFGYYWHSASGHLAVMNKRVDIEEMLANTNLDNNLRERLLLVQQIRRFSIDHLALPDNDSYSSYVELDNPYVIQNLFAAAEFSTRLHSWCYPIIGCASYRGYYDEDRLNRYVAKLEAQNLEVYVGPVSAYSTLGWFDDPVLSSFIEWPDYRLAGLLFHELTHQRMYIDDDTEFNESLASAVQQAGILLWLQARNQHDQLALYQNWLTYRRTVMKLIGAIREELSLTYQKEIADAEKRRLKSQIFDQAGIAHAQIAQDHAIQQGYTRWFASDLNNAKIGSVAAYNNQLPAFINMIEAHDHDFDAFFDYAEKLGAFDKLQRDRCLDYWQKRVVVENSDCPARL